MPHLDMSKTYFLVLTRDTPPSGPIFLGSIIKSPRSPELSINGKKSPLLSNLEVHESTLTDSSRSLTKNGKSKTGVWAEFLNGTGISAEVSGTWDTVSSSTYKFSALITRTISPSLSEIQAIFQEPGLQQTIKDSRFRDNLYMITGIKIARGAEVAIEKIKKRGGNLNFGVDWTPFGVPIKVGPDVGIEREIGQGLEEKHTSDFVFAYRLREIRYRRKTVEEQKEYLKGDLMGVGKERSEKALAELEEEAELVGLGGGDVKGDAWEGDATEAVDEDGEDVICVMLDEEDE